MIENIVEVEKAFGLEEGKLSEMISSEESHKVDLENLVISTKDDFNSLIENHKKIARQEGVEILIKKKRDELGLDFTGKKTLEPLLEAYAKKIEADAKIEPNEKYDNLKVDFEKRGSLISEWEDKYNTLKTSYTKKDQQRTIDNTLLNSIPNNTTIPKEDVLAIIKAKYDFNIGEDGFEIIKDGQVQKNKSNMNLLTASEFVNEFINPYLKKADGGAGGKDSKASGKVSSLDIFNKQMEDKGINIGSEKYNFEMSKGIKDGTLKF